jgi:hypothetical protein
METLCHAVRMASSTVSRTFSLLTVLRNPHGVLCGIEDIFSAGSPAKMSCFVMLRPLAIFAVRLSPPASKSGRFACTGYRLDFQTARKRSVACPAVPRRKNLLCQRQGCACLRQPLSAILRSAQFWTQSRLFGVPQYRLKSLLPNFGEAEPAQLWTR